MNGTSPISNINGFGFETIGHQVITTISAYPMEATLLIAHDEILNFKIFNHTLMTLFPNPAISGDAVRISLERPAYGNINIKIFNQHRDCVLCHLILNADGVDTHFINIQNLKPGIYSVELEHNGLSGNQKLIIQ